MSTGLISGGETGNVLAWPPPIPPATRADATDQLANHPGDHNAISTALTAIVAQFAALPAPGPAATYGTVANAFTVTGGFAINPGTGGVNYGRWSRIGRQVFYDATLYVQPGFSVAGSDALAVVVSLPFTPAAAYGTVPGDTGHVFGRLGFAQVTIGNGVGVTGYSGLFDLGWALTQTVKYQARILFLQATPAPGWNAISRAYMNAVGALVAGSVSYLTDDP